VGKRNGGLSKVHPADLGSHVIEHLVKRSGIDPSSSTMSSSVVSTPSDRKR
jgi:acetyl-CoA acetyltransferase